MTANVHLKMLLVCGALIVAVSQSCVESKSMYEAQTKLVLDLGATYLTNVAPTPIKLRIGMSHVCASYDNATNVLTSRIYQRFLWVDGRMTWNPPDYDGINLIRVPISRLWSPDIKLLNAFDEEEEIEKTNAIVLSNGTILWLPPATLKSYCEPAAHGQRGRSHCKLILGSWTFSQVDIELELFRKGFDTEFYLTGCPYVITQSSAAIIPMSYGISGVYPRLEVNFDIEPRPHVAPPPRRRVTVGGSRSFTRIG